ncbi:MAG: FadR/GntR family transcriptional regulator [Dehalobacterium sp.]
MFNPIVTEKKSVYEKIVQEIRNSIFIGDLKPGDRLPSERKLAEQLNVSRTSVREAIRLLSAENLVQVRHGQGVFIAYQNPEELIKEFSKQVFVPASTLKDLFEMRLVLETQGVKWAIQRGTNEQLENILNIVEQAEQKTLTNPEFNYSVLSEQDNLFHNELAKVADNKVMIRVMNDLLDLLYEVRFRALQVKNRPIKSLQEHKDIALALINRDQEKATAAIIHHLENVEKDILESFKK